jgi:Integrase zinc binding domain
VNFLACGIIPHEYNYQQRKKFLADVKHYFWDEPWLFKLGIDDIHRRCIPETEIQSILFYCHASSYGGHTSINKTAARVLQVGFYWPTLFKDVKTYVQGCDRCQRMGNITRRNEMPLNKILKVEIFDVWGSISWDRSRVHAIINTFL